jgi:non-specific serine/threonine protein kinase
MAARRPPVGNLPADLTSFVGRTGELSQVRQLLSQSRLVTLTGVGGVGKSRLALRVAHQLTRVFADGTWWVELSPLQDGALLPQAIGAALGLTERVAGDPAAALSEALAQRSLLMVVDNCEHLVPECQELLTILLRAAPGLRILATSREVLRIPGEQVCEVVPLDVPRPGATHDPDSMAGYPAVALFARRASEVRPSFAVSEANAGAVAAVCGLSEGLPLFLELAAAQLRRLSVEQLARRLHDRFQLYTLHSAAVVARHQSLRAAVEWSYTLCTEAERLAWIRVSVFAGRFDLEAAEAVCTDERLPGGKVLDALAGLIDKSVLSCEDSGGVLRYSMLDTLREYGLGQLRASGFEASAGERALRRRHRDYYTALAERFAADWFGPRQREWARRIRAELPEIRAAMSFSLATPGEAAAAIRLVGALDFYWWGCGAILEGSLWVERALAADPAPSRARVRAMAVHTRILISRSLHAESVQPALDCVELARQFGDPAELSEALSVCGLTRAHAGDPAGAVALLDEALALAEACPDRPITMALATLCRGGAALAAGELRLADAMATRSREVAMAHGDRWWLNYTLSLAIQPALLLGDVARATAYGRQGLVGCAALEDVNGLTLMLELLAWTAATEGEYVRAARLLGAAERQSKANGGNPTAEGFFGPSHDRYVGMVRAALGGARFSTEFLTGTGLTLEETVAYAHSDGAAPQPRPAAPVSPAVGESPLTRREHEIAELIAQGMTNKQIAHQLVISQRTAEGHVEHILAKLGFATRTQVASWVLNRQDPGGGPLYSRQR